MPSKKNHKKDDGTKSSKVFRSVDQLWAHMDDISKGNLYDPNLGWYGQSTAYWNRVPATQEGVLAGNTGVLDMSKWHEADISESRTFIESIPNMGRKRCVDCGAGIGRVSRDLLSHLYETCDLMESQPHMLEKAREHLKEIRNTGEFLPDRMEMVTFPPRHYDLVFVELAAMYLTDKDLVSFLKMSKTALTKKGFIFLKENCAKSDQYDIDPDDNGLLRTSHQFTSIFAEAGVRVIREETQKKWPQDYATLKMYALQ